MTPERWKQIDGVLQTALTQGAGQRLEFLAQACAGDPELRIEVESLIGSHDEAGNFLSEPAIEMAAESIVARAHQQTDQLISHYQIISPLGVGGMSEVYLARDKILGRQVALKLLPKYFTQDPDKLRRFEQEARFASTLTHPNICVIHEVGATDDGRDFIAMEYVEGRTLRQQVDERRLSINEAIEVTLQIGNALSKAHTAGIVHRDIKPENVMVAAEGFVKVLDFGIAKFCDQNSGTAATGSTNPGMILGTTAYMSPEQVRALNVDARSDIWSLGAVFFEMLAGRSPFAGATPSDCIAAILERDVPDLTAARAEVPAELKWIVGKMLRKDRDERYQTIRELLSDLRELKSSLEVNSRLAQTSRARSFLPFRFTAQLVPYRWMAAVAAIVILLLAIVGAKYYPTPNQRIKSLAVLPFVNVGGANDSEAIADGVTEDLIDRLSKLTDIKVIARNSVFRYRVRDPQTGVPDPEKVARELGVQAVLIGRVIQQHDDLFVSAELVNAADNSHIWGAQYNRKISAGTVIQEQIARDISRELKQKLVPGIDQEEPFTRNTQNLKAFDYYMQGRSFVHKRTREDLNLAGSYYQKAIEQDQNYALAYAGLAEVYGNLGVRGYISPVEGRQKLGEAAGRAVALDDNLAEAHVMMGYYYMGFAPYRFTEGDRELRRAIELSPSLAIAHLYLALSLLRQTRLDEGLAEMLKARELDPFSSIIARQVALYYLLKRDYPQALQILKQANEMGPPFTTTNEIGVYIENKLYDQALTMLESESRERKQDPLLICGRGMIYAVQGRKAEALKTIKELEGISPDFSQAQWIAKIYCMLNEKEQALDWLERGLGTGTLAVFYISEPTWDKVRDDPRFQTIAREVGVAR